MTRKQYKLMDRLIRRLDRLNSEEYEVWTAVANILIKNEIRLVYNALHEMFTEEQIASVRLMQSRAKSRVNRYEFHRWVSHAVHCKLGYHDEEMISRVTGKFKEYDWARRFGSSDGIPF